MESGASAGKEEGSVLCSFLRLVFILFVKVPVSASAVVRNSLRRKRSLFESLDKFCSSEPSASLVDGTSFLIRFPTLLFFLELHGELKQIWM